MHSSSAGWSATFRVVFGSISFRFEIPNVVLFRFVWFGFERFRFVSFSNEMKRKSTCNLSVSNVSCCFGFLFVSFRFEVSKFVLFRFVWFGFNG